MCLPYLSLLRRPSCGFARVWSIRNSDKPSNESYVTGDAAERAYRNRRPSGNDFAIDQRSQETEQELRVSTTRPLTFATAQRIEFHHAQLKMAIRQANPDPSQRKT
jgi:hypothetical protein